MDRRAGEPIKTTASLTVDEVVQVWRADRCLKESSIRQYLQWIARFRRYCRERTLQERTQLTRDGAKAFATWYARRQGIDVTKVFESAGGPLYTWACACRVLGVEVPLWRKPASPKPITSPLLRTFALHLREDRGNPDGTVCKKLAHIEQFLRFLHRRRVISWRRVKLTDIDRFLIDCSHRYARSTTADFACSVRAFLRFLRFTGRLATDLAPAVIAPVIRKQERPRRALPWEDVQRLLGAVDRSSACGLRDYAMLLLMSTYGFGAGEVIRLRLDDIDWTTATIHVVRPKTGVAFTLPLLPAVARVLARYLSDGRPRHAATRYLFVQMKAPHGPLSCASPVRHVVKKHASLAGINAPYLGAHVLRHTHAARQIELGACPRVVGDILGHRDPESISAYVRIATERLRDIALPVPA